MKRLLVLVVTVLCFVSCEKQPVVKDNETMFQFSTIQSLMVGNYDGFISTGMLRSYGDHGIGTFERVDGEMIIVNDSIFQAKSDGSVIAVDDNVMVPFAVATHFDNDIQFTTGAIDCLDSLLGRMTDIVSINGFNFIYTVRIDIGGCDSVRVRSVVPQQKPYKPLYEALKTDQREFTFYNTAGTIVGVYFPEYMGQLNATGWHCHFISEDRSHGGHLLNISFEPEVTVRMDLTPVFSLHLPEDKSFANSDISKDLTSEIEAVEK